MSVVFTCLFRLRILIASGETGSLKSDNSRKNCWKELWVLYFAYKAISIYINGKLLLLASVINLLLFTWRFGNGHCLYVLYGRYIWACRNKALFLKNVCSMALCKIKFMCGKDALKDFLYCCIWDARLDHSLLTAIRCIVFVKFCVFRLRSLPTSSMSDSHCDHCFHSIWVYILTLILWTSGSTVIAVKVCCES